MSTIERFKVFYDSLSPKDREDVDRFLIGLMKRFGAGSQAIEEGFPDFSTPEEVDAMSGRPLPH